MNGRRLIPGKSLPASEVPDYTVVRDTLEESLSSRFATRLRKLNEIVVNSGEALEGNIFYQHRESLTITTPPATVHLDRSPAPGPHQEPWRLVSS